MSVKFKIKKLSKEDSEIDIKNQEGLSYLESIPDNSIDLILTDPPYIISHETGMNKHYNDVKDNEKNGIKYIKTLEEWENYKKENNLLDDSKKENYMKYGSIYGKKYCVKTDYGEWDNNFTIEELDKFVSKFYTKLRKGGTMIMFFDLWKLSELKEIMERHNFKQLRFHFRKKRDPQCTTQVSPM